MTALSYDLLIAGIRIRIRGSHPFCLTENLLRFQRKAGDTDRPDWLFEFAVGTEDVAFGKGDHVTRLHWKDDEYFWRVERTDGVRVCRLYVPRGIADSFVLHAHWTKYLMMERMLLPFDRLILHSSAVITEGQAILFTAPSGVGKSTQAALWETHAGAEIINGDKVIVSAGGEAPVAYGGPIAGTSRIYKDVKAPISAIVYLRQGPENKLTVPDPSRAFMALYSQAVKSSDDESFNKGLIPLIESVILRVPVVELTCQPNASAVEYLRSRLPLPQRRTISEEFL